MASNIPRTQTTILVAGLGRFYGAAFRLTSQLKPLENDANIVLIKDNDLRRIVSAHGGDSSYFGRESDRGYGYYAWKPILIAHYAQCCDYLIYIDAGSDVNPFSLRRLVSWFQQQSDTDLCLARTGHSIADYTADWVIQYFGQDVSALKKVEMLAATIVFLKTSSGCTSIFHQASLLAYRNPDLYSGIRTHSDVSTPDVETHRHDQSLINLLLLKSRYLNRVRAFDTSFTPNSHKDLLFDGLPAIIAGRNCYSVSMYWPLMLLGVSAWYFPFSVFPRLLGNLIERARIYKVAILINKTADLIFSAMYQMLGPGTTTVIIPLPVPQLLGVAPNNQRDLAVDLHE